MEKVFITIHECKAGDMLAQDLISRQGVLLIPKETVIDEILIEKLEELGISSLYIYQKEINGEVREAADRYEVFVENYQQQVSQIKTIINDLAVGKDLNAQAIHDLTDSLYSESNERDSVIQCLSTLKAFDEYTYNHSVNVSLYSMLIANWLKMPEQMVKDCIKAGLLHDIGKASIPDKILNKKGKLTNQEFAVMKQHPTYGYHIAQKADGISDEILKAVLLHHEREDGTGYPIGVMGEKLNILTKIVAIADVYDALTSERVYKKRISPFETFQIIETTGLGYFDTMILLTFLRNIASYYIGANVLLSTGEQGTIVHVVPHNISRPIVCVSNRYIDTGKDENIKIVSLLN